MDERKAEVEAEIKAPVAEPVKSCDSLFSEPTLPPDTFTGPWKTIYADPPWNEMGGGKITRGAQKHYPLMKTRDIERLPVGDLVGVNAHCYLWATNNHLLDALEVLRMWGFRYVTMITWAKDRMGLGQYYRGQTEHCLFGVCGVLPYRKLPDGKRAQGRTIIHAKRTKHSRKPDEMREMIKQVSPPPYLELFARQRAKGWSVWGNEVESNAAVAQAMDLRLEGA